MRAKNAYKILVTSVIIFSWIGSGFTVAQEALEILEIPSSINPVGSGARALGMGGAFIAVADDATAASWNPGGLIQLENPEVSIVGSYFQREEDNTFGERPEASGLEDVSKAGINYISAAYPFSAFNRNMIVSLNYQNLYDFSRHWEFPLSTIEEDDAYYQHVNINQKGSLSAIGIAYCVQMTPHISLGLTLNIWQDPFFDNEWERIHKQSESGIYQGVPYTAEKKVTDHYSFRGVNANLGFLWNITDSLSIGLVLKTPFTAELEHTVNYKTESTFGNSFPPPSTEDEELDMPISYGAGLAYRFSDKLTASIDAYRTEWDDYLLRDSAGNEFSPINKKPKDEAGIDPTVQLRAGLEYLYITNRYVVPLRCGVFYDPAPAEGSPDDYYGFSFGSGIARGKFIFDAAYQYRFGNDVGAHLSDLDFSQDVREHTLYTSLIYHF